MHDPGPPVCPPRARPDPHAPRRSQSLPAALRPAMLRRSCAPHPGSLTHHVAGLALSFPTCTCRRQIPLDACGANASGRSRESAVSKRKPQFPADLNSMTGTPPLMGLTRSSCGASGILPRFLGTSRAIVRNRMLRLRYLNPLARVLLLPPAWRCATGAAAIATMPNPVPRRSTHARKSH